MIPILSFGMPVLIAIFFGWRAGRDDPQTRREFVISAGWALAWCAAAVFLWHALWVSAMVPGPWTATVRSCFMLTGLTALLWLPLLMISYVARALKARRS